MCAVIARGLDCGVCAIEIGKAAQRAGLSEAVLAQVLTHLDAPELDTTSKDGDAARTVTLGLEDAEALFAWCKAILTQVDEDNSDPECDDPRRALLALEEAIAEGAS
jgi:hypothetical protein